MNQVNVMVVGATPRANDTWQKRVGGVLQNIAEVRKGLIEDIIKMRPDLVVCYNNGAMARKVKEITGGTGIVALGVSLTLLPIGIKTLYQLGVNKRVGVVAHHLRCANILLSEIVSSGFFENRFITGTFTEMRDMDVNFFVAGEEMVNLADRKGISVPIITIPRGLSPYSVATLVNTVNEIAGTKFAYPQRK